jgi:general nucleoside transport system permease protein
MSVAAPAARRSAIATDIVIYLGALAVAVLVTAGFIAAFGKDPLAAYRMILQASVGSAAGAGQTMNKATPLLLGSLAVALAMRAGFFNIGVDGQIYAGAIAATAGAFLLAGSAVPAWAAVPALLATGTAGGALLGAIPAVLRAGWGISEIFVTVMLNFVAFFLTDYLTTGPWNDPVAGEAISRPIPAAAVLPQLDPQQGAHAGIVLALAIGLALAWLLTRTWLGYQIRAAGDNPVAARLGGINLVRITLVALIASGGLAGLAGAVEVTGVYNRLILGLTPGYGILAILIAVLARRAIPGVILVSLGFAILLVGSDTLQRSIGFPSSAVYVFQAITVLCVLMAEAAVRRRR